MDPAKPVLTPEERSEAARIIAVFSTRARNNLLYVDYHRRRGPELSVNAYQHLIGDSRAFYRMVRPYLDPLP
jgi:hypothetical protein